MLMPREKLEGLDTGFVEILIRIAARLPFALVINEAVPPNKEGSHVKDSEHFEGVGVDVSATNGYTRFVIVQTALSEGIKRIGVYDKHIHLGGSSSLPSPVMWPGKSK